MAGVRIIVASSIAFFAISAAMAADDATLLKVFVLDGNLVVEVEGEGSKEVASGGIALIPAGTPHLVRNDSAQTVARALVTHSRADKEKPFLVVLKKRT